jgi:hypothetical protein
VFEGNTTTTEVTIMMLRSNVRNFLVGLTISEIRDVLAGSVERGETRRADFIEEYLREVEEEEESCDDVVIPLAYF